MNSMSQPSMGPWVHSLKLADIYISIGKIESHMSQIRTPGPTINKKPPLSVFETGYRTYPIPAPAKRPGKECLKDRVNSKRSYLFRAFCSENTIAWDSRKVPYTAL